MDYPIRAESGKGRSAHIFNLNERAVTVTTHFVPGSVRRGMESGEKRGEE